jgi:hypothetical protein
MAKVDKVRMVLGAVSLVGLSACAVMFFADRKGQLDRIAWGVFLIAWPLTWLGRFLMGRFASR